jgi:cyanophycinase-like exopeptidase
MIVIFMRMKRIFSLIFTVGTFFTLIAQTYTANLSGDTSNAVVNTSKRLCLMGGATEDDNAIQWWLQGAQGGDVVVIRVTGSTSSYNTYFNSATIGVPLNSVETFLLPSISAANHPYVKRRLREAEAIWICGGNQNLYRSYWQNTAVDSAINWVYNTKGACIGGTSAGMMIQGQFYYYAGNASVTSANALTNPFNNDMTIAYNDFLHFPILTNVITDTHFDNPDRKGRLSTFMARNTNTTNRPLAIACDEYTAVCVDSNGMAKVFGGAPTYQDYAYFLQVNCVQPNQPETLQAGTPLTFNRNNAAIKAYKVLGNATGSNSFDLNNWQTASGGSWENWYIINGNLSLANSTAPSCVLNLDQENKIDQAAPIYFDQKGQLKSKQSLGVIKLKVIDVFAKTIVEIKLDENNSYDTSNLDNGIYFIQYFFEGKVYNQKINKAL